MQVCGENADRRIERMKEKGNEWQSSRETETTDESCWGLQHLLKAFCSAGCGSRCWDSSEFLSHIRKIPQKHCDCSLQGGMTHHSRLMVLMLIKTEMRIVSQCGLTSVIQLKTEDFNTYNMLGSGLVSLSCTGTGYSTTRGDNIRFYDACMRNISLETGFLVQIIDYMLLHFMNLLSMQKVYQPVTFICMLSALLKCCCNNVRFPPEVCVSKWWIKTCSQLKEDITTINTGRFTPWWMER